MPRTWESIKRSYIPLSPSRCHVVIEDLKEVLSNRTLFERHSNVYLNLEDL